MSAAFVVDCSIAIPWPLHDEATPKTTALLHRLATETTLVPSWWFIEITNVLAMAERKGRIAPAQFDAFIADLSKLGIERDEEAVDRLFPHVLALCQTHRRTSYGVIYLDLANAGVRASTTPRTSPDFPFGEPTNVGHCEEGSE